MCSAATDFFLFAARSVAGLTFRLFTFHFSDADFGTFSFSVSCFLLLFGLVIAAAFVRVRAFGCRLSFVVCRLSCVDVTHSRSICQFVVLCSVQLKFGSL